MVVLRDLFEVQEIYDLYAALDEKHPLTTLCDCAHSKHNGEVVRVTVRRKDGQKREAFVSWKLGDLWAAPGIRAPVPFDSTNKFKPEARVTIRVSAPEIYRRQVLERNEWDSVAKVLQELASWKVAPQASLLTGGQWQWQKAKQVEQLVRHLRVAQAWVPLFERNSGRNGVFVTLTKVDTRCEVVKWILVEESEARDNYHRRCLQFARSRSQCL